jgi:hypothetical protein
MTTAICQYAVIWQTKSVQIQSESEELMNELGDTTYMFFFPIENVLHTCKPTIQEMEVGGS